MNIKRTLLVEDSSTEEFLKSLPKEWAIMIIHQAVAESVLGSLDEIPAKEFWRTSEFSESDYLHSSNLRFVPVCGIWKQVLPFSKNSRTLSPAINPDFLKPGRIRFAVKPKAGHQWDLAVAKTREALPKEAECDGLKTKPIDLEISFEPDNYDWEIAPVK